LSTVIKVEDLSKNYLLRHVSNRNQYTALRDVLSDKLKNLFSKKNSPKETLELFWALKDISFEVKDGERIGIIGRNGAGKSTLLKVLSRITEPTLGKISLKGRVASLLEVGTGFHPELSGRENIFLNGSILGMRRTEIKKKFDEIVAFAEVEKFLDTPVKRYSSGMYVRLAFAVAAHLEPEILIVDEVLAVGDMQFQKKCMTKMQDVSRNEGRTILFVSHNMEAIQRLCTNGILLDQGRLISTGDVSGIVKKYLQSNTSLQSRYKIQLPENASELPGYVYLIQIENENNIPVSEIPIGNAWQIRVLVKLNRKTEHLIVGVGVVTAFDVPLRTSWSEPRNYSEGEYEIVFKNKDIMLTSGLYKLNIGLSCYQRAFQYIPDAAQITISNVSELTADSRIVNSQSGILINPMEVEIVSK
jgi:lipopolysaccharide transport system ATP-binding protein